jgi:hypothetical protein
MIMMLGRLMVTTTIFYKALLLPIMVWLRTQEVEATHSLLQCRLVWTIVTVSRPIMNIIYYLFI